MRKFHELADDDSAWDNRPLTLGSISRALGDAKEALASAQALDGRVDNVDEMIEDVLKSADENALAINDRFAKLDAEMAELKKSTIAAADARFVKFADFVKALDARTRGDSGLGDLLAEIEARR
jgi:hypothetical protein